MINRAEQTLDKQLVARIAELERQVRDIKAAQPLGGDVVSLETVPSGSGATTAGPLTLSAGGYGSFKVTNVPTNTYLTQWNFLATIYVDGTTGDDRFPNGANIGGAGSGKLKLARDEWTDWYDSDDSNNTRVYYIRLHNEDTASHNYYLAIKAYLPKTGGVSVVNPGSGGGWLP